jgi:hypothetical protein
MNDYIPNYVASILDLAFFIYLMVAFSISLNTSTLEYNYNSMILWTYIFAIFRIVIMTGTFLIYFIIIIVNIMLIKFDSVEYSECSYIIIFGIHIVCSFTVNVVFMILGIQINDVIGNTCVGDLSDMCNYYNNYFRSLLIILLTIVSLEGLSFVYNLCVLNKYLTSIHPANNRA